MHDKLAELGLEDDTVVVVLGDHGWLLGEHNEWAKNQLLPEALRTALWMRGPGITKAQAAETFVEFVDIHATLCELAGIEADGIDGRSFAKVHKDPTVSHRDHAYTRFGPGDAITTATHYYVRWKTPEHGTERLLIDLETDPLGKRNLAGDADQQERVRKLDGMLDAKIRQATSSPPSPSLD